MTLKHTEIARSNGSGYDAARALVAKLIPHLKWRRHGIGVLQGYVSEGGEVETRVHVWSPRLMLAGIQESGNVHNHRFAMRSLVLAGWLQHTEYQLVPGDEFTLYDFVHARLHTEATRADMRPLAETEKAQSSLTGARLVETTLHAGDRYTFERWAFHSSLPLTDVVVTLVEKYDQVEERARVLAPAGRPPVPAFGAGDLEPGVVAAVLADAVKALQRS